MSDKVSAENLLNNFMDTLAEKWKPVFEGESSNSLNTQFRRLFGRQKPVHHLLGGGKSADILLWRDKKISASVLTSATSIWFIWSNASGYSSSMPTEVPRLALPEDFFVNIATTAGAEVNRGLRFLQDVSCGGNLKQFLVVVGSLMAAAMIGGWCNFITVIYIGFVAAHTLPVLYEKHEDEVDNFVYKVLDEMKNRFGGLDAGLLSRISKSKLKGKKHD
ncbi:hypothetical protein QN277_016691 [Acacia crassicarpa]|uniref:Reticulon-like protein n=1 Tax=Acacia crassicarpa TaxID=499986 RepID=A0AAE1TBU7_9FABA|nr:hypothetical protein QN277_016691 [Acacia crassicarpa]